MRSTSTPGSSPGRRDRDLLDRRQGTAHPGIGDHPSALPALQSVLADVGDAVDAERVAQERDRATTHDRDATDPADERGERFARRRERNRGVGVVDDRCERAVEVDEDRGAPGVLDQRVEHAATLKVVSYVPRMTTQFAVSLPVGGGLGIASTFGAPSTDARPSCTHGRSRA